MCHRCNDGDSSAGVALFRVSPQLRFAAEHLPHAATRGKYPCPGKENHARRSLYSGTSQAPFGVAAPDTTHSVQARIRGFACTGRRPGNPVTRSRSRIQGRPASDLAANMRSASLLRRVREHALALSLTPVRLTQSLHAPARSRLSSRLRIACMPQACANRAQPQRTTACSLPWSRRPNITPTTGVLCESAAVRTTSDGVFG